MTRTIGELFMHDTHYDQMEPSDESRGLPQPPLTAPYNGSGPVIPLKPAVELSLGKEALSELIDRRQSLRKYAASELGLDELAFLLWSTQGVKRVTSRPVTLRTVPSAGARHAFETFVLVNRVENLEPGLYQYLAVEHQLGALKIDPGLAGILTEACLKQEQIRSSAATFFWVAVTERMHWRYGERGYRYLHLDAGHVCQNLALAAEAIGCGICPIAAFNDDALNTALGLDGEAEFVVYLASLGKRQ